MGNATYPRVPRCPLQLRLEHHVQMHHVTQEVHEVGDLGVTARLGAPNDVHNEHLPRK